MKREKLSLDALKVKSFVTSIKNQKEKTVRGGEVCFRDYTCHPGDCFSGYAIECRASDLAMGWCG